MVFYAISAVIALLGLKDLKRGFFLLCVYKFFLVKNVSILSLPGVPQLTVDTALTLYFFILFLIQRKKIRQAHDVFPWKLPMAMLFAAWVMSSIFSLAGLVSEFANVIKLALSEILIIWMMWELIEDMEDFKKLFILFTVCYFVSAVYGIYEAITHSNPLVEYEASLVVDKARLVDWSYGEDSHRGYRIQSVFEHAIGAGINWALYVVVVIILWTRGKLPVKYLSLLTAILCLICIVFCNSRGPILFFIIACLVVLVAKTEKKLAFGVIVMMVGVIFIARSGEYFYNFMSIFDPSAQARVGGSSFNMRMDQFSAAWELMMQSPLFGLGSKFLNYANSVLTSRLRGSESIWLSSTTKYGLFGVASYIILIIYSIYIIPKRYRTLEISIIALAYWVTYSMTSVPGTLTYIYYMLLIFLIKDSEIYKRNAMYQQESKTVVSNAFNPPESVRLQL